MPQGVLQTLFVRRGLIAWVILLVLLGLTLLVWYSLKHQNEANASQQFKLHVRDVVGAIEQRLNQHEQILLGGAGLFDASEAVTRQGWQRYVERLHLAENYPGILGVGFSQVISPAALSQHIMDVRAEGFPHYTVKPPGKRDLYTAIIYLEPFSGRNLAAFGYDMFSQETRRKAMQTAVDQGVTSISGKVTLVQETHGKVQAGFLMYVPIYLSNLPTSTAEERWRALKGFVYSPYRVDDLMKGILGERNTAIDFIIHDQGVPDDEALMYDSSEEHGVERALKPRFSEMQQIKDYGHSWTITLFSRPGFDAQFSQQGEWLVLLLGIGVSMSLFLFVWSLAHRREEALRLANEMTLQLRVDEARLAELIERFQLATNSAGIGVWEFHPKTNELLWSEQMYRLYQVEPGEFSGDYTSWSQRVHPDDLPRVKEELSAALKGDKPFDTSLRILWGNGEVRYLKADARVEWNDQGEAVRVIGVNYDITPLRRVEEEIRHSRQLLANVLQAASDFSIIATDPDGLITIFNSGAERMLGYSADEMVGKQTPAIIHLQSEVEARGNELSAESGEVIEGFRVFVTMAERMGSERREWTYLHKDGRHIPVSLVVSVMRGDDGNVVGYLGVAQDITQRKQIEATLRDGRERLNEAQRIAKVGSWSLDLRNNHLEWSDEIYRIFEIDPNNFEASYGAFIQAIHPEDRELVNKAYKDSLFNHQPYEIDHRLLMADGRVKYVQERGETLFEDDDTPILSRGTMQDITLIKQVEMAREEQAHHTQTILDNVLDGIITINARGIVTTFNMAAEKIFGFTANEVVGQNVKILMPEPYHSQHDSYLSNYLTSGEARVIGIGREVSGRRKDGSVFPMELAVSEIQHQGESLFIGMVRDITERKRVERMKSEFVATVSHELRTPLTSISGALGLLNGGALGTMPAQAQHLIDIANKNSQRLTHLINDLLDMEKMVAGKLHFDMQVQPLMPLVEQALVANERYGAQYQVTYVVTQRVDDVAVNVDSQRLMQVLSNFLSNAAKFSPAGGRVEVAVQRHGEWLRISIHDHGSGIPDEFLSRIFQKFSQADSSDTRQKGGTGLGLAITKELVERMGGKVGFQTAKGNGTTFYFELPICSADRESVTEATSYQEEN